MIWEAFLRGFSVQNASPQPLTDPQELSKGLGSKMSFCWLGWDFHLLSSFGRCTNNWATGASSYTQRPLTHLTQHTEGAFPSRHEGLAIIRWTSQVSSSTFLSPTLADNLASEFKKIKWNPGHRMVYTSWFSFPHVYTFISLCPFSGNYIPSSTEADSSLLP